MKNTFVSKNDLAQAYFPYIDEKSARHKMMGMINENDCLLAELKKVGYNPMCHSFSPVQMQLVMEYLGNPFSPLTPEGGSHPGRR